MTIKQYDNKLKRTIRDKIIKQTGADKDEFIVARSKVAGQWCYVIQSRLQDVSERISKVEIEGMRASVLSKIIVSFYYIDDKASRKEVFVKEEKDELQTEISA